jgi:hypothetical protein
LQAKIGLCHVWGFEIQMMKIRTKSYIEKLLPELKPNSEPMLMGIAAAPILQNPLLYDALVYYQYS